MTIATSLEKNLREKVLKALERGDELAGEVDAVSSGDAAFQSQVDVFAKLERWRRELEEALSWCKERAGELSGPILEEMALNNIDSLNVHGLKIRPVSYRFVNKKGGVERSELVEAMRECGFGHLVEDNYAPASLKSAVLELLDKGVELPERLANLLNVHEETRLSSSL